MFYIIPTPIGNIQDISLRAIETIKICDYLLCENTQTTQNLLKYFNISKSCYKYTSHSTQSLENKVLYDLQEGKNIGIVSEAGTPGISDPGNKIINIIISKKLDITCLPGPTSIVPALILSGFNTKEFTFLGFLPHKGRTAIYKEILFSNKNIVCFESIYRIEKTISELYKILEPERKIAITREISKSFETIYRGNIKDFAEKKIPITLKGELVLVIERKQ